VANVQHITAQLLAEGVLVFAGFLISLGKRGVTISLSTSIIGRLWPSQDCERQMAGAVDDIRSNIFSPDCAESGVINQRLSLHRQSFPRAPRAWMHGDYECLLDF